jgi:hypothetical protein
VHEAARTIATLINTLDAEATELITTPARDTDIPAPPHQERVGKGVNLRSVS